MGRHRPVAATTGFSAWQPAMLAPQAGFGQKQTFCQNVYHVFSVFTKFDMTVPL
jgi:hypothetical protein